MAKKTTPGQDKSQDSAKQTNLKMLTKDELFENFFENAEHTLGANEVAFGINNLREQFFGVCEDELHTPKGKQAAHIKARNSYIWRVLSALYEYAVNGVMDTALDGESSLVIEGAEMLALLETYDRSLCAAWYDLVSQADGRFALDEGVDIELGKLALLANIDVRTVRNAISAGDLTVKKVDSFVYVDNASARKWLLGRKGFKPSILNNAVQGLEDIRTPAEFATFLTDQRKRLGLDSQDKLMVMHPQVTSAALSEIEQGVFRLPLDTVYPIADFYRLNRKKFLLCVMELFFSEQFASLRELISEGEGA